MLCCLPQDKSSMENQKETEEQYVSRRLSEENAERFHKEFQQSEILRVRREAREAEEAKATAARQARDNVNRLRSELQVINSDTETCPVCGTNRVPVVAISHPVFGTNNRCIRKPKAAKAIGLVTPDAWDMLTDDEKTKGYIIIDGTMLSNEKMAKDNTPEPISGAPNCYGMKLF
jgi:hypothetical protein